MTLSGQAPLRPPAAASVDGGWEEEEPEEEKTNVAAQAQAPQPATPQPAPATTPRAPNSAPALASLTAEDLRTIVREMIDHAVLPLQHRIAELERRPRAASMPAIVVQQAAVTPAAPAYAPTPTPALVASPAAVPPAPVTYASAMAAPAYPAPAVRAAPIVSTVPQVDIAALARDMPLDFDVPFDGRKRNRRTVMLLVLFLLAVFGGLAYLLVDSYTPKH
jgi:hypothetical protein